MKTETERERSKTTISSILLNMYCGIVFGRLFEEIQVRISKHEWESSLEYHDSLLLLLLISYSCIMQQSCLVDCEMASSLPGLSTTIYLVLHRSKALCLLHSLLRPVIIGAGSCTKGIFFALDLPLFSHRI